jgi:hypothetical protein
MLANPLPQQSPVLLEGFCPTSNCKVNHSQFVKSSSHVPVDKENTMLEPFCGLKNMKPTMKTAPYTPSRDLHNGDFIFA